MWLRLGALWGCTVREARRRCDAPEFALWRAYFEIDPWGEERADLRAGFTSAILVNAHSKKGSRRAKPTDFLLSKKAEESQTVKAAKERGLFMRIADWFKTKKEGGEGSESGVRDQGSEIGKEA
jgi:hypothetical protein